MFGVAAIAGAVSCGGVASKATPDGGPDGAAGGGGGGAVLARVFEAGAGFPDFALCDAEGGCPEQQTCFRLAAELAVCDLAAHPLLTQCLQTGVDQCGCGVDCPTGLTCTGVALTAHFQGACLPDPCASPEDCPGGSVCTPTRLIGLSGPNAGRCFTPTCTSDADCTGGVDGRCALVMTAPPAGGGDSRLDKVRCVFVGLAANATACAPEQATSLEDPSDPNHTARYYTCAGR